MNSVRFYIVVFCLSTLTSVVPNTSAAITVSDENITSFINKFLDREETFPGELVPNRAALLAKYLDDSTFPILSCPQCQGNKYNTISTKALVTLVISMTKEAAVQSQGQSCDPEAQRTIDSSIDIVTVPYYNPSDDLYKHLERLDASGKKFCNFFAFLSCSDEAGSKCSCPSEMVWETDKCVFKRQKQCDFVKKLDGRTYLHFDLLDEKLSRTIYSKCEQKMGCGKGAGETYVCGEDEDSEYLASPKEIAGFQQKYLDNNLAHTHTDAEKTEILRNSMTEFTSKTKPMDKEKLKVISMEQHMQGRLADYGTSCDLSRSPAFDQLMEKYNPKENPYWSSHADQMRLAYQRKVMEVGPGVRICNHFRLLSCSASGTCDCRPGLSWDSKASACGVNNGGACGSDGPQMKLFSLERSKLAGSTDWTFTYKTVPADCLAGNECDSLPFPNGQYCIGPAEQEEVLGLREDFAKLFTTPLDGACSVQDQTNLFQPPPGPPPSFADRKKGIQASISGSIKYCQIRKHASCSSAGKCACVSPFLREGDRCLAPAYGECGFHRSDILAHVEKLVLPNDPNCPPNSVCVMEAGTRRMVCSSGGSGSSWSSGGSAGGGSGSSWSSGGSGGGGSGSSSGGNGGGSGSGHHVELFETEKLPEAMKNPEGTKLIAELHRAVSELQEVMTIEYGSHCDAGPHETFKAILDFAYRLRQATSSTNSEFDKAAFEGLLQQAKDLAAKSPTLCDLNNRVTCIAGACACPDGGYFARGSCFLDLAQPCKADTGGICSPCRPGTDCICCAAGEAKCGMVWDPPGKSPPSILSSANYLEELRAFMVDYLKEAEKRFKGLEEQGEGKPCSAADSEEVTFTLTEVGPLTDPSTFPPDPSLHIRLMQEAIEGLGRRAGTYLGPCGPGTPCDPNRGICTTSPFYKIGGYGGGSRLGHGWALLGLSSAMLLIQ